MKTEYQVVCANHGTQGHTSHKWKKRDKKKAVQSVIDLNHHAETVVGSDHFYAKEAPYKRQERKVSAWEDSK